MIHYLTVGELKALLANAPDDAEVALFDVEGWDEAEADERVNPDEYSYGITHVETDVDEQNRIALTMRPL